MSNNQLIAEGFKLTLEPLYHPPTLEPFLTLCPDIP